MTEYDIEWRLRWIERYIVQQLEQQLANKYFVDPELRIKKTTGTYCQDGVTEKEYFCLEVRVNRVTEQLDVYSVENGGCSRPWGCYGTPFLIIPPDGPAFMSKVGTSCMYVLPPGNTYVISYVRRGTNPLVKVKKFRVIDPDHAEVLEEWSCEGALCVMWDVSDASEIVKRMCKGGEKA